MSVAELTKSDGTLDYDAASKVIDAETGAIEQEDLAEREGADAETTTKPAEEPSGKGKEESADTEIGDDNWVSREDIRELIDSLGLSEDDAREFSGPEELERHARFVDRQFMQEGKRLAQQLKPGEEQEAALASQDEAQRRMAAQQRASQQPREGGKFAKAEEAGDDDPPLNPEYFDEELVSKFNRQAERIKRLEERIAQADSQQQEAAFHSIADSLGYEDLFGKGLNRNSDQQQNLAKLLEATDVLIAGMASKGKAASLSPALVRRALNQEFADLLSTKNRRSYSERMLKQSGRKLGSGGQRVATGEQRPWNGPPEKDPALHQAYREMEKDGN